MLRLNVSKRISVIIIARFELAPRMSDIGLLFCGIFSRHRRLINDTLCQAFTREWARNFLAAIAFFACIGGVGLGLFCEYSFIVG